MMTLHHHKRAPFMLRMIMTGFRRHQRMQWSLGAVKASCGLHKRLVSALESFIYTAEDFDINKIHRWYWTIYIVAPESFMEADLVVTKDLLDDICSIRWRLVGRSSSRWTPQHRQEAVRPPSPYRKTQWRCCPEDEDDADHVRIYLFLCPRSSQQNHFQIFFEVAWLH